MSLKCHKFNLIVIKLQIKKIYYQHYIYSFHDIFNCSYFVTINTAIKKYLIVRITVVQQIIVLAYFYWYWQMAANLVGTFTENGLQKTSKTSHGWNGYHKWRKRRSSKINCNFAIRNAMSSKDLQGKQWQDRKSGKWVSDKDK